MPYLAVLLIAYLPGYATARCWAAWSGQGLGGPRTSPFPEVLLSLCLSSWLGFLLAECGAFSLRRLCVVLLLYSVALVLCAGRRAGMPSPRMTPAVGAALAAVAIVGLLYLPPFDTSIMASDASFYLGGGVHLARSGTLSIADPLLAELSLAERIALFPLNVAGGWARIPGGLLLPSLDATVVYPSFSHMLPVWIAIVHGLGGLDACGYVAPAFAGLALWAIWLFASETSDRRTATLATLLVATNLAQWFYARFLMPEIVSQFFLWGGLLAFVQWWRQGSAATAVLAAFALGIAGLTRVELFVLLPCAVTLFLALSDRRPGTRAFLLVYGTLVAHGFVHLVLVPSHYGGVLRLALLGSGRLVLGLGALASLLVLATVTASERFTRRTRRALAALAVAGGAAAFAAGSHAAPLVSVEWLAGTTSWAVLAAAAFGLVLWGRNLKTVGFPLVVFLVAGVPLLYDAHVTEVQLWAVRRFVPVVIPFVCLLAATTIAWSTRLRGGALLGGSLAALLLVGNARPLWRVRSLPFHPAQAEALAALARQVPENAVVFFAPELAAYLIHVPLWLVHDREPLVLPLFGWETVLARTAPGLSRRHPVLYVGNAFGGPPRVDGLAFQPRAEIRLETLVPALDVRRAPTAGVTHLIPLRLYDVSRREAG